MNMRRATAEGYLVGLRMRRNGGPAEFGKAAGQGVCLLIDATVQCLSAGRTADGEVRTEVKRADVENYVTRLQGGGGCKFFSPRCR